MVLPDLPVAVPDQEALGWVVKTLDPSLGLRAALLAPLDTLAADLSDSQRQALSRVRQAFIAPGPFSYVPLSAFLWQWAAYSGLVSPATRAGESINQSLARAGDIYAKSPLFKALTVAAEGKLARFWGVFGQWGSLFLNHGTIKTQQAEEGRARLVFEGHVVGASRFYVPGLLLGWMRHFGEEGEVSLEVEGERRFVAAVRW